MTDPFSGLTGMPRGKPTRRGKRHRNPNSPGKHSNNALAAHKAGDFATARSHAFKFMRAVSRAESEPDPMDAQEAAEPQESEDTMPSVSQAQRAAMQAAAQGRSTLGIPKAVGQEFAAADQGRKVAQLPEHVRHQKLANALKAMKH